MAIAVISDIHANLQALEAVLRDVDAAACDELVCLGDLVGYGGDPEACVQLIREHASVVLLGNHDAVAAGLLSDESFNDVARGAIRATGDLLSESSREYLASLPHDHAAESAFFTHAHPVQSEAWTYIFVGENLEVVFQSTEAWLMVIGHTHTPGVGTRSRPVLDPLGPGKLSLLRDERYLYNVGSVGQPRDRDARAAWARFDPGGGTMELRRVAYDIAGAQRSIRDRAFPEFLAERLAKGM